MKKPSAPKEPTAPKTEEPRRLAAIFHRRSETKWSVSEIKKYLELLPIDSTELGLVERYYKANWPPRRGHNILRTDLITLLGNWPGEVDRARVWTESHPLKPFVRKIIPLPVQSPPEIDLTEEQKIAMRAKFAKLMGRELHR